MARGGKSIQVKIATAKVIKALEQKLVQLKEDKANEKSEADKFNKILAKYNRDVIKLATSNINKYEDVTVNVRYNGDVNLNYTIPAGVLNLPEEPKREYEVIPDWQFKDMVEEIENAIRILKMTDDEYVNTSTYNTIAKYL